MPYTNISHQDCLSYIFDCEAHWWSDHLHATFSIMLTAFYCILLRCSPKYREVVRLVLLKDHAEYNTTHYTTQRTVDRDRVSMSGWWNTRVPPVSLVCGHAGNEGHCLGHHTIILLTILHTGHIRLIHLCLTSRDVNDTSDFVKFHTTQRRPLLTSTLKIKTHVYSQSPHITPNHPTIFLPQKSLLMLGLFIMFTKTYSLSFPWIYFKPN